VGAYGAPGQKKTAPLPLTQDTHPHRQRSAGRRERG
jgi:hypothetical protein